MNKKIIILVAGAVILVAVAGISYPLFIKSWLNDMAVARLVKHAALTNPQVAEMYQHVKDKQAAFDKNKDNGVEQYLSLGLVWKSLADQVQDPLLYHRALDVYEAAIAKFNRKNSLIYINAADIYRQLKNYEMAEKRYLQALELDPGDVTTQLNLINLYVVDMKKPEDFVKARYTIASKSVLNQFPIAVSFAEYVRSLGEYDKALEFYKTLYQASHRPEFKQAIQDIEALQQNKN